MTHRSPVLRVLGAEIADKIEAEFSADDRYRTCERELKIGYGARIIGKPLSSPLDCDRPHHATGNGWIHAPERAGVPRDSHERLRLGVILLPVLGFSSAADEE